MHPLYEAILFLLRKAHASGNHPDGEAEQLIQKIEWDYASYFSGGAVDKAPAVEIVADAPAPEVQDAE